MNIRVPYRDERSVRCRWPQQAECAPSVPAGTWVLLVIENPALKRWAIVSKRRCACLRSSASLGVRADDDGSRPSNCRETFSNLGDDENNLFRETLFAIRLAEPSSEKDLGRAFNRVSASELPTAMKKHSEPSLIRWFSAFGCLDNFATRIADCSGAK